MGLVILLGCILAGIFLVGFLIDRNDRKHGRRRRGPADLDRITLDMNRDARAIGHVTTANQPVATNDLSWTDHNRREGDSGNT